MKLFKVTTLAVLGLFLVNCDNSKSNVDDIKQKSEQTGSQMSDNAQQVGSDLSDKVQQMSADVSDKAKEIGAEISDKAKQTTAAISDKAKDLYEQTKSEKEDMLKKIQEGNYSVAENLMIKAIKAKLPATIDQNTTLVDVSTDNKAINYKYVVNNTTKDALQAESNKKEVRNKLIESYCSDDSSMKTLRLVFPRGANYNYYINDDKVFSVDVKSTDCDDD
ncbi:hypothetical protein [Gilliamella sp. Pas-s25]|uniref:hypothetical protein n=1 Tax=Gilliamella sp. Pas-s25 TaxID=2687310 RepID=UPI00135D1EF3|nr:hypothetical protein [Gilliamella sp. Pas-s25]MWP61762.1 hypothetical protein [Gilliamella sp. Pas-s25]